MAASSGSSPQDSELVELDDLAGSSETHRPQKLVFVVDGVCCAAEVELLRQALNPLLKDSQASFNYDMLSNKMTVESKANDIPSKEIIIRSIEGTGLSAVEWKDPALIATGGQSSTEPETTFWHEYGHIIMNIISAIGLIIGFIVQVIRDGWEIALGGGVGEFTRPPTPPIATIVFYSISMVAGVWFIAPKAWSAVRRVRPDPNLLMTIAMFGALGVNHWFEAATSMYLFSAAGLVERWNMARARKAIRALMELAPSIASVINTTDGSVTEHRVEEVPVGAIISVKPGELISMDSVLIKGHTAVNQAPITGESMPVPKELGDPLFAGTINGDGAIQCRVTKLAAESTLASIIRKVEEAQSRRALSDQWIERFSFYYVPAVMVVAILAAIIPPLIIGTNLDQGSTWYPWVYRALMLLVISCPCSLVISTPVTIVAGLTAAARSGVLIKGGIFLETAASLKAFGMDKTGTLTTGQPVVQHVVPLNGLTQQSLLRLAASMETQSDHPLARAILNKAKAQGVNYQAADNFVLLKGKGAEVTVNGVPYWLGSHRFMHEKLGEKEPTLVHSRIEELEGSGNSVVVIGTRNVVCGIIGIADSVRPESKSSVRAMKDAGIEKVIMLTGDNAGAAKSISDTVGLDQFYAELLPEDKVKKVEELMQKYGQVAMVGDGVNDTPAMATASLGISMGAAGSDAAIETADIALMSDDLSKLAWLVKHARNTVNIIKQNVAFSLIVKAVFMGLIFANKSTLWMAMASDMGATFVVVSNALRLVRGTSKSTTPARSEEELGLMQQSEDCCPNCPMDMVTRQRINSTTLQDNSAYNYECCTDSCKPTMNVEANGDATLNFPTGSKKEDCECCLEYYGASDSMEPSPFVSSTTDAATTIAVATSSASAEFEEY